MAAVHTERNPANPGHSVKTANAVEAGVSAP